MAAVSARSLGTPGTFRALVVGDTQRVMPIERIVHVRDTNDAGRAAVARAMLAEVCDVKVHLGDLVGTVGSARDWARFDSHYPPDVFGSDNWLVCRGNHDCSGLFLGKDREFAQRYPDSIGRLRVFDFDFIRLVLLDTNAAVCQPTLWEQQRAEFVSVLRQADSESAIQHVLVFGHHPPMTNGRWIRSRANRTVRATFFEPFLACRKTRAFFAGHVHGYERFVVDHRVFIVSGGGGGPRVPHLHGTERRHPSDVDIDDPHPLHYLRLNCTPERVSISTRYRHEVTGAWGELDFCEIHGG